MRNTRRDAFYWIRENMEVEEMSFVEIAREFRADPPEKAIELHPDHYEQINKASDDFSDKIQSDLASGQVVDTTQGPNEKKALAYLDGFMNLPFIGEPEKNLIKAAKNAIKLGKFQQLQRDVNNLKRNVKKTPLKPVDLLDVLLKIIEKYPIDVDDNGDFRPTVTVKSFEKYKPEIIISESFSFNN